MVEAVKMKVRYEAAHYRNDKLSSWVIGTFKTAAEQDAAWQTIKFIRESWPEAEIILRGKLIGIDEGGD